ncbi:HEAT repeat domain-containing protein [Streptomyces sp. NPDC004609]|uniref:HEAT repeat domain-containing protein n=1 Tax=Streptomyces sp. NPDC004609 TaxID=3364704 RepID=UPI00368723BD
MDLERIFADLDGVRWAELEHAYGDAEDVPDMLRGLVGDEEQASEALDELWGSVIHQGTVYGATAETVPFLARLAAAGVRSGDLLLLLGAMAESTDEYGLPRPGLCRAAVVAGLPLILPLCGSGDPEVRRAAVWTAGRTKDASVLPVLHVRRSEERDPGVRAELLAALAHVDPLGTADAAAEALTADAPAELRVVAVMACLDAGLPWSPVHRDTMLALLPADPVVSGRFDQFRSEPLRHVVNELLLRDTPADRASAYELIEAALRLTEPGARGEALGAAEHACLVSRGAPARLAPVLLSLLSDPSFTHTASLLPILDKLGGHATPAAPALAALAAAGGDLADRALEILTRLAPEQAAPLLARDLGDRSRTLAAVVGFPGARPAAPIPYAPELLNAIRIQLTAVAAADDLKTTEPGRLTALLASWGPRASAALPELTALFHRSPSRFARALAAVCPPESRDGTAELLRKAADRGPVADRYAAAEALRGLTGETGPLLSALQDTLGGELRAEIPETAGTLGADGSVLVPQLRTALTPAGSSRTVHEMNTDIRIALALWRLTGDAAEPLRILGGVLAEAADGMWMGGPIHNSCRAAAELGVCARPLAPVLESLLADPEHAPTAVLALHAADTTPAHAADLLLTSAELHADPVTALEALRALGTDTLTAEETARLTALGERDLRVVASGPEPEIIPGDERFQDAVRKLLTG